MKVNIGKYSKNSDKPRRSSVTIDDQDVWNADQTLAIVTAPLLIRLKSEKQGAPLVEDSDVPEGLGLRSTECKAKENEWDVDDNHFKRWDWVLDEMIWAMQEIADGRPTSSTYFVHKDSNKDIFDLNNIDFDRPGHTIYENRLQNALELFGKYFQCLWS